MPRTTPTPLQDLEGEAEWVYGATDKMGLSTHYRRMEDGALCVKTEGFVAGVEPLHMLAVYRLVSRWRASQMPAGSDPPALVGAQAAKVGGPRLPAS